MSVKLRDLIEKTLIDGREYFLIDDSAKGAEEDNKKMSIVTIINYIASNIINGLDRIFVKKEDGYGLSQIKDFDVRQDPLDDNPYIDISIIRNDGSYDGFHVYEPTEIDRLFVKKEDGYGLSQIKEVQIEKHLDEELEGLVDVIFENQNGDHEGASFYESFAIDRLLTKKQGKEDGYGLSEIRSVQVDAYGVWQDTIMFKNQEGNTIGVATWYAPAYIDYLVNSKQDAVYINDVDLAQFQLNFSGSHNFEYRCVVPLEVLSCAFEDSEYPADYTTGISFDSGDIPTSVIYSGNGIINWVGTDCTTSDGLSIFQPTPNTHYDIVFYFNGKQFIGLVNGFKPASGNVVSE